MTDIQKFATVDAGKASTDDMGLAGVMAEVGDNFDDTSGKPDYDDDPKVD